MSLLICRLIITLIIVVVAYFALERTWTKNVDILAFFKGPAELIPIKDGPFPPKPRPNTTSPATENNALESHSTSTELHTPSRSKNAEFSDLVHAIMPTENNRWDGWETAARQGSPITWTTVGHEDPPDDIGRDYGVYSRKGTVVLFVNGQPAFETLNSLIEPGIWEVTALGPRAGMTAFRISGHFDRGGKCPIDVPAALRSSGFDIQIRKAVRETRETTENLILYVITAEGKVPTFLAEFWSMGNSAGTQDIWLFFSERDALKFWLSTSQVITR